MKYDLNKKFSGGFDPLNQDILKKIGVKPSNHNLIFQYFINCLIPLFTSLNYNRLATKTSKSLLITQQDFINIAPFLKELEPHFEFINNKISLFEIDKNKIALLSNAFYEYICQDIQNKEATAKRKPSEQLDHDIKLIGETIHFLETKTHSLEGNILQTINYNNSLNKQLYGKMEVTLEILFSILDELSRVKTDNNHSKNILLKDDAYFKKQANAKEIKEILQDINKTYDLKLDTYLKNMLNSLTETKDNIVKIILAKAK